MQNKLLRIFIPQTLPLRGEYSLDALVVNGDAQCPVSLIVKPDAISRLNAGHEAQLKLFTENSSASQACAHVRLEATCCTDCKVKCAGVNLRTEYSDFAQSQVILFTPTGFGSHYNYARASAGTTAGCNWDKILYLLNQTEAPTTTQYRQLIWRLVTLDRIAGNAKCISCSWQHMKRRRARLTGDNTYAVKY